MKDLKIKKPWKIKSKSSQVNYFLALGAMASEEATRLKLVLDLELLDDPVDAGVDASRAGGDARRRSSPGPCGTDPGASCLWPDDSCLEPEDFLFWSNLRRICRNMSSDKTTKMERICRKQNGKAR